MRSAKELLLAYLENVNNPDKVIELFADDGILELPYLGSLGLQYQMKGKEAIYTLVKNLPNTFSGFKFQNIQIHIDTPKQAFGEYEVHATVTATGRPYSQLYMGRLVAGNGKIKLLREALDMIQVAKGMFPNGLEDVFKL
jgi:ketosteroid isomerase-like protein